MLSDLLSNPAILLLTALVVVLLVVWLRTRERRFAVLLAVASVLLVLFGLWKTFGPESDAAQIKRKLYALGVGVRAKQIDQVTQHVSEQFSYQGLNKQAMTGHVARFINSGELADIEIWKDEPVQFKAGPNGRVGIIEFKAKPKSKDLPTELYFHVIGTFVMDGDGQWRLQGFELFRQPGNQPVQIPQLPLQ